MTNLTDYEYYYLLGHDKAHEGKPMAPNKNWSQEQVNAFMEGYKQYVESVQLLEAALKEESALGKSSIIA